MGNRREFTDLDWEALKYRARDMGTGHGCTDGASYDIADVATARRILAVLDDGVTDDEISESLPTSPLSGQFSDDPTPASLYRELGIEPGDDSDDGELCRAYEDGHYEAMTGILRALCREMISSTEPFSRA